MNHSKHLAGTRLLAGGALLLLANLAQAQYTWIDEKGLKQFSDRAPPPSTPASKILRGPTQPTAAAVTVSASVTDAAAQASAAAPGTKTETKPAPTLAERNADFRKRGKEQAEREQKAAEEAQDKAERAENCDAARAAKAQIDSGVRLNSIDKNGERTVLSDAERAQRAARAAKVIDGCR
jgi:hypothetical protein